jgi:hypothetical protein
MGSSQVLFMFYAILNGILFRAALLRALATKFHDSREV